jgi:hypothetical protein
MFGLGGLEGIANKPTLEDHVVDYRINIAAGRGEEALLSGSERLTVAGLERRPLAKCEWGQGH